MPMEALRLEVGGFPQDVDFIWLTLVDVAHLTEAAVMEYGNFSHIKLGYPLALRAIQGDIFSITVVSAILTVSYSTSASPHSIDSIPR